MHPQAQQFRPRTYFPMTQQVPFLQVQPPQMQMYHPMMPNHNETVYYQYQWLPQPLPPSTVPLPSPTPTRSLLLYKVPTYVSETIVRTELQVFGEVKSVGMERLQDGIVTVHFYDLRHSAAALAAIQNHYIQHQHIMRLYYTVLTLPPLAHRVVAGSATWAQFYVPSISADDSNQGILVVRNLDREISSSRILEIFESFGAVKELREAPLGTTSGSWSSLISEMQLMLFRDWMAKNSQEAFKSSFIPSLEEHGRM
ncbi:protein terminal ear1-like [Macadamia integrifolia]|uniref:protein terminal ear1-like n=1 Tax=Macadamia integrifolia TaxID=60698 RepID=UPI001C4F4B74|nr:protein terminal ear1-like [Macadamia integrifolia]